MDVSLDPCGDGNSSPLDQVIVLLYFLEPFHQLGRLEIKWLQMINWFYLKHISHHFIKIVKYSWKLYHYACLIIYELFWSFVKNIGYFLIDLKRISGKITWDQNISGAHKPCVHLEDKFLFWCFTTKEESFLRSTYLNQVFYAPNVSTPGHK